jgi:hypothetical protein
VVPVGEGDPTLPIHEHLFAAAVRQLIADPKKRADIGTAAMTQANALADKGSKEFLELVLRIVAERAAR